MRIAAALIASAIFLTVPAFAQDNPTAPASPVSTEPAPATPAPEAAAPTEQTSEAANDPDRIICRTVRRSESRLRGRNERICGTRDQWEEMQDRAAREMNRVGSIQNSSGQ